MCHLQKLLAHHVEQAVDIRAHLGNTTLLDGTVVFVGCEEEVLGVDVALVKDGVNCALKKVEEGGDDACEAGRLGDLNGGVGVVGFFGSGRLQ